MGNSAFLFSKYTLRVMFSPFRLTTMVVKEMMKTVMFGLERRRVLLAGNNASLRYIIRQILESQGRFEIVGEALDEDDVLRKAAFHIPDVVLLGGSPNLNCFHASNSLKKSQPNIKVVVLSYEDNEEYRRAAQESGASAYISLDRIDKDLPGVMRSILR